MEGSREPTGPIIRRAREAIAGGAPGGEARDPSRRAELREWMSEVSGQIEEIIDAAEQAAVEIQAEAKREAEEIRAEARREAGAYLDERRREADDVSQERVRALGTIGKPLLERVERLRAELATAAAELDRAATAIAELNAESAPTGEAPRPAPSEPLIRLAGGAASGQPDPSGHSDPPGHSAPPGQPDSPRQPDPSGQPDPAHGAAESRSTHEGAILRATQLAVLGKDKAEIEATLRDEFELADPAAVVDSILGPG